MPNFVPASDRDAHLLSTSITDGDLEALRACVTRRPELATVDRDVHQARTRLHIATDWPDTPGRRASIELLVAAGVDVDAPFVGAHTERPLHWAASSGDLEALDALIVAGADLEAPGGVLTGGPPLDDAVIFDMLDAATRLVACGASTALFHAAAAGLTDRVEVLLADRPDQERLDASLWHACHHGRLEAARLLVASGADPTFEGFADTTTREAARLTATRHSSRWSAPRGAEDNGVWQPGGMIVVPPLRTRWRRCRTASATSAGAACAWWHRATTGGWCWPL